MLQVSLVFSWPTLTRMPHTLEFLNQYGS